MPRSSGLAFDPKYWNSPKRRESQPDGSRVLLTRPANPLDASEYSQMEANFSSSSGWRCSSTSLR